MWNSYYKKILKYVDVSKFPMKMTLSLEPATLVVTLKDISCRRTGNPMFIVVRRRLLQAESEDEALRYIYWCVQEAVLHEVAETFKYKRERIFDPHEGREKTDMAQVIPPEEGWQGRGVLNGS